MDHARARVGDGADEDAVELAAIVQRDALRFARVAVRRVGAVQRRHKERVALHNCRIR